MLEKEEYENAIEVLKETKIAILQKNAIKLRDLSNRTVHSSCSYQDPGSVTAAVLIYALSKLIERGDISKIKDWDKLIKKFNSNLDLAILALEENNSEAYALHMQRARKVIESGAVNLKPYIKEVIRKASINKGSKLYAHGLSLEKTARLLGITQWELSEYTAQIDAKIQEINLNNTMNIKKRAQIALEFLS